MISMTIIKDEKSRDCESLQNSNGELATGDGIAVTYVLIGYPYIATMYVCYKDHIGASSIYYL